MAGKDASHTWGLAHVKRVMIDDQPVLLAPPEYVIIRKLQFYREGQSPKHLRDIHRMRQGLGEGWDRRELDAFVHQFALEEEWALALEGDA